MILNTKRRLQRISLIKAFLEFQNIKIIIWMCNFYAVEKINCFCGVGRTSKTNVIVESE